MTEEFGDRAIETAEGYFWYGKALLEVTRNQQDFLGTKADNEDVENVDPKGEEKAESPVESLKKPLDQIAEEQADEPEESKTEDDSKKEDLEEDGDWEDAKEDDVEDQQLAYEMFELARNIYESALETSVESETKRAECHMSIGEIQGENGQIEEAIDEYHAALAIFEKVLPDERKRRIAEVYFSLGCSQ